jgi:beta-galactosidase
MPVSLLRTLCAGACAVLFVTQLSAADSPPVLRGSAVAEGGREHLSLDANWKFHLGDDWPNASDLSHLGTSSGPITERFNDSAWRPVNLPHDWGIELPFDRNGDKDHSYRPLGRNFPSNSIAWYRRAFELPQSDSGKRIWLTFDGAFRDTTVWVNGWLVRRHEGGYNPFREDITDVVHFGGRNTVAVRVDATKFEGWFYEGAGIYRHVWLDKTAPVAIAPDGIFVRLQIPENDPTQIAKLFINTVFQNHGSNSPRVEIGCEIYSPEGQLVVKVKNGVPPPMKDSFSVGRVSRGTKEEMNLFTEISNPVL